MNMSLNVTGLTMVAVAIIAGQEISYLVGDCAAASVLLVALIAISWRTVITLLSGVEIYRRRQLVAASPQRPAESGRVIKDDAMDDSDAIWAKFEKLENRLQQTEVKMTEQLTKISTQMETLVNLAQTYVTKERFQMVQIIVYGFAGIILTSVIGAMLAKVIMK